MLPHRSGIFGDQKRFFLKNRSDWKIFNAGFMLHVSECTCELCLFWNDDVIDPSLAATCMFLTLTNNNHGALWYCFAIFFCVYVCVVCGTYDCPDIPKAFSVVLHLVVWTQIFFLNHLQNFTVWLALCDWGLYLGDFPKKHFCIHCRVQMQSRKTA